MVDADELRSRIKRIHDGSGVDRDNYPKSWRGEIANEMWDTPQFGLGMEYGYILAMLDLINGTDSTK